MARTKVTRTQLDKAAFATVNLQAADATNKNYADMTGYEILVAYNTDAGAQTVTINSGYDPTGRTKDITAESLAAGAIHAFGPFKFLQGWAQGNALNFEASDVAVEFAWIAPPLA